MRKWKKIQAVMLAITVTLGGMVMLQVPAQAAPAQTVSDSSEHMVMNKYTGEIKNKNADNILGYTITDTSLYNRVTQQQYIKGYFYNASDMYHILGMEGTEIVVQDLQGNKLFEMVDADYSEIEELILPPRTKVNFNANVYSPKWMEYDLSEIEAFVVCKFSYEECVGEGCGVCGGPVTKELDLHDKSVTGVSESMELCFLCDGSGECKTCKGKGYSTGYNGKRRDCSLCGKTGACFLCAGKGEVKITITPGSSSSSHYGYDDDFDDFTSDDDLETGYKCPKCKKGVCSDCNGTKKRYGSMCFLCMGSGKCYYCGGDGWVS